jgi:signal transduction histidine kinase
MQIRARLTLLFALLAAGILAGVLLVVYFLFKKNTEDSFYKGLALKADMTAQTALQNPGAYRPMPANWLAPDDDTLPYYDNISIYNQSYERVFSLRPDAPPITAKNLQDIYQSGESRFGHFNLLALGRKVSDGSGTEFVVVVEGYCDPTELTNLRNILAVSYVAGLLLIALGGWYYAGLALAPMSRIVEEVSSFQADDLSRRLRPDANRDEISRLSETFNQLLDRVEQAFKMQRMFLSNVSHELRNPLTAIRAQIDVALQRERDPEAYRRALLSLLDDVRNLSEVEEKLMQLARIYNDPGGIPFAELRLDELLWQAKKQLQKRHTDFKVSIELGEMPDDDGSLFISANESLLSTALLNLMGNACKYSPDKQVLVRAHFKADKAHVLEICDRGPGIPDEEKELIFEPFFRSPRHLGVKGTGIGLSLVKSILALHHVSIKVEDRTGGGAVFRLTFLVTGGL